MAAEVVYLNGKLVPRSKACISPFDHCFLYGYGLFETMRAYNGRIFLIRRHLARLMKAAAQLGIDISLNADELEKACNQTLEANKLKDARVRLTVSRGEADWSDTSSSRATVLVTASDYQPPSPKEYTSGYRATVATFKHCSNSLLVGMKTTNYMANIIAREQARAAGLDEALFLNERGHLTEGATSNLFLVTPSLNLVTPPIKSGLLPGITREFVIELAGLQDIKVIEADVSLDELRHFTEAFLTNSLLEIMPLVSLAGRRDRDKITIGSGKPGQLTRQLMAAYKEAVEQETAGEVDV